MIVGMLFGLPVETALVMRWAPEPGQIYRLRLTWEAVAVEPRADPADTHTAPGAQHRAIAKGGTD